MNLRSNLYIAHFFEKFACPDLGYFRLFIGYDLKINE